MKKTGNLVFFLFISAIVSAQSLTVHQYINTYKEIAISEMKRTGVPASITIAQGILETESGNSNLVLRSNNHFGIKCKSTWTGPTVYHDDDERGECFRKYSSADESFRDHSEFLRNSDRYASLFLLDITDYKGWAHGLKKAGYATNPRYPNILIHNIEKYNLHQYTLQGLTGEDVFDKGKYKDAKDKEQTMAIAPVKLEDPNVIRVVNTSKDEKKYKGLKAIFVSKGTSLLAIATDYNIALSKLMDYNGLESDGLLAKDQWIFLEKGVKLEDVSADQPIAATENVTESSKRIIHEVLPKQGLYAISKKYSVSVSEIKNWNKLESDDLRVGQKLIILNK